jgi:hypothetical protein
MGALFIQFIAIISFATGAQYFAEDKPFYSTFTEMMKNAMGMDPYQNSDGIEYPCMKVQCSTSGTKCFMYGPEEEDSNSSSTKTDLSDGEDDIENVILLTPSLCGVLLIQKMENYVI